MPKILGGFQIGQYLMQKWSDDLGKQHIGFIDKQDEYMKLRADEPDYVGNSEKLRLFNFKRDKTQGYERCQAAINQGLVIFPKNLNIRQEIEFEEIDPVDESIRIRYEKVDNADMNALVQVALAKEQLASMIKIKKPNGTVTVDLSPEARSKNMHDDHADVIMMMCDRLMELRALETLETGPRTSDFSKIFGQSPSGHSRGNFNPFSGGGGNPFGGSRPTSGLQ